MTKVYTVPSRLKTGFNKRESTTNGLLGYVVFFDPKTKKLRKEVSFNSWSDKNIEPLEFDNVPTSGFLFSSSIVRGGHYRYDSKVEKVRVYDPRGFDVEISMPNLMNIIEHYDILKTEIKGEMAYAWYNNELILLPTVSDEYNNSVEMTDKFNKTFSLRDLTVGQVYETKVNNQSSTIEHKLYIGRFDVNASIVGYTRKKHFGNYLHGIGKKHIFAEIVDGKVVSYEVVKPNSVVGELEIYDDLKLNSEILEFKKSVHTKEFEKNIYLIKFKKDRLIGDFLVHRDSAYGEEHFSNLPLTTINDEVFEVYSIFNPRKLGINDELHFSDYSSGGRDRVREYYKGKTAKEVFDDIDFFSFSAMKAEDGHFYSLEQGIIIDHIIEKAFLLEDISNMVDGEEFKANGFNFIEQSNGFEKKFNSILKFMRADKKSRYVKFKSLPLNTILKNYKINGEYWV